MAQPFTLKLGGVDLSNYVRLAPGEGFDPVDATGFQNPAFSDSPLAEGQLLSNIDIVSREMAWPLHLNAATKDAAHALIASINTEIALNQSLRVEWKDQGASNSTFYDVAYARFEPDYSYRKAAQNWESGTLRIWCAPPFGHTGTTRIVATGLTPSLPISIVPIPSLAGDVPALMRYQVAPPFTGTYPRSADASSGGQQIAAVAVLPHPSYVAYYPAASITVPSQGAIASGYPTYCGATWAYGSQAITAWVNEAAAFSVPFSYQMGQVNFPATSPLTGRNRVLGLVTLAPPTSAFQLGATLCMWAIDQQGNAIGPTAVISAIDQGGDGIANDHPPPFGPRVVDLGVYSMPSYAQKPCINVFFGAVQTWSPSRLGFGVTVALNSIVMMPDETLTYIDSSRIDNQYITQGQFQRSASVTLDGIGGDDACYVSLQGYYATYTPSAPESISADGLRRGAIPRIMPSPTAAVVVFGHTSLGNNNTGVGGNVTVNDRTGTPIPFVVSARERFQFAR